MSEQTQEQAVTTADAKEGVVLVPISELRRLEQVRLELFRLLGDVDVGTLVRWSNVSQTMWEIANRKWPSPPQAFDPGLWQMVPKELTRDMVSAYWFSVENEPDGIEGNLPALLQYRWHRMLDATPPPPAPDIAQIRARFEADFKARKNWHCQRNGEPGFSHEYEDHVTQAEWRGWCAALGVKP